MEVFAKPKYSGFDGSSPTAVDRWHKHPFIVRLKGYLDLTYGDLECLWRLIEVERTVKKGRDLVVDGYEYRKLCFVEDGFAARYKVLHDGRRQIVNFVFPGDIVGLPGSFLEKAPYSVIGLADMKLQICSLSNYVELCCRHPRFGLALSWLAVYEAVAYAEHIVDTGRRSPTERLARLLLEIYSRLEIVGKASALSFTLPFSQEIMSDALGLSVPHLNRTLRKLRTGELIKMDGRRVEFLDVEALGKFGQFQALNLTPVPLSHGFPSVSDAR